PVRRPERHDRARAAVPAEALHVVRRDEAALRVPDDRERAEARVPGVDPLDLGADEVGEVVDAPPEEGPAHSAEVEREDAVAVPAQPPLEDLERPPRAEPAVEEEDGARAVPEV